MKRGTRIIGVLLIIVSICALIAWEKWGKNELLYDDILVLEESVSKGTLITENMLKSVKMDSSEADCIKASEKEKIIGLESAFFIHKGAPLFRQYFVKPGLTAGAEEGKYILSIPEEWQLSVPETMKRGDKAYFFINGKFVTWAMVSYVNGEDSSFEVVVTDRQAESLSKIGARGERLTVVYH